jgi:hypothetical protein
MDFHPPFDGAAQESNLPSRGLHDRTGFEDPRYEWPFAANFVV